MAPPDAEVPVSQQPQMKTFTAAERIAQLNAIDKDITALLTSASQALKALTTSPTPISSTTSSLEPHKARFTTATQNYFRLLSSVDVGLRRQIYALEEAHILPPAATSTAAPLELLRPEKGVGGGDGKGGAGTTATAGERGMGGLDVGWLNSRGDSVGREMEGELWREARAFVERIEREGRGGADGGKDGDVDVKVGDACSE
ncbi:MAG: hypothetical protein M1832_002239 [Thelocarpon impressellum]|nr:MAG: hypothetical protein M1832_002239 [Thelocarpon impressellum]